MIYRILLLFFIFLQLAQVNAQTGVVKAYSADSRPSDKYIKVGCKYFNLQMELVRGLPYLMCLPITVKQKSFFFFSTKKHYWFVMDGEYVALLDEQLQERWHQKGRFNHDISWDPEKRILWTIQEELHQIKGEDYSYFALHGYNLNGKQVKYWSAYKHLDKLTRIGYWKERNGVKFPLTSRDEKRNTVLMANYLKWLEHPWKTGDGKTLERGTLLVNIRYLNALLALDENFNITWSYHFNPSPQDAVHFDIHTPQLSEKSEIVAFVNSIEIESKKRSGVFTYDTGLKDPNPEAIYLVPLKTVQQEERSGGFGSVQILADHSLFISTGSEYGGITHLNSKQETIFEWINPKTTSIYQDRSNVEYPAPIYRASLVDLDWVETL